jgi:hypothetical protein
VLTDEARSHRDPIGFTAESLGKAKTSATLAGAQLIDDFQHIEKLVGELHELGIDIGRVRFDDPVTQAAWMAHIRHDEGPPLMQHEDEIARRRAAGQ